MEDKRQPYQQEHLIERIAGLDWPNKEVENQHPKEEKTRQHNDNSGVRFGLKPHREKVSGIHSHHQKLTVRKVDNAHHSKCQRKSDANQAVHAAKEQSAHNCLQYKRTSHLRA